MATLLIAEKSKAAQAIAEALGPTSKDKVSKYVYVYYVKNHDLYVVPLRGHIKGYKNTKPYQKWTAKDPREIITNPKAIFKMSSKYAGPYISALKKYAKRCNLCIIGTDADVEGCNIGLIDALPYVQKVNPRIEVKQM